MSIGGNSIGSISYGGEIPDALAPAFVYKAAPTPALIEIEQPTLPPERVFIQGQAAVVVYIPLRKPGIIGDEETEGVQARRTTSVERFINRYTPEPRRPYVDETSAVDLVPTPRLVSGPRAISYPTPWERPPIDEAVEDVQPRRKTSVERFVNRYTPEPRAPQTADETEAATPPARRSVERYTSRYTPGPRTTRIDYEQDTPVQPERIFIRGPVNTYTPAERVASVDDTAETPPPAERKRVVFVRPFTPAARARATEEGTETPPLPPERLFISGAGAVVSVYTPARRIPRTEDEPEQPNTPLERVVFVRPFTPAARKVGTEEAPDNQNPTAPRFVSGPRAISYPPPRERLPVDEPVEEVPLRRLTVVSGPRGISYPPPRERPPTEEQEVPAAPQPVRFIQKLVTFLAARRIPAVTDEVAEGVPTPPRIVSGPRAISYPTPRERPPVDEVAVDAPPRRVTTIERFVNRYTPAARVPYQTEEPVTQGPLPARSFIQQVLAAAAYIARRGPPRVDDAPDSPLERRTAVTPPAPTPTYTPARRVPGLDDVAVDSAVQPATRRAPLPRTFIPARRKVNPDEAFVDTPARRVYQWFLTAYNRVMHGRGRVANTAVAGYTVYVGYGQMPDFGSPAGFGTQLPVAATITPPLTGTMVLWVVVRKRDAFGLESQNTQPRYITIDTDGDEVLGALTTPAITGVVAVEGGYLTVSAVYPGLNTDAVPADTWRLYVADPVAESWNARLFFGAATWAGGVATIAYSLGLGQTDTISIGDVVTVQGVDNGGYDTVGAVVTGADTAGHTFSYALPVDPGGSSFGGEVIRTLPLVAGPYVLTGTGIITERDAVARVGPYPTGTYFFAVAVHRAEDDLESDLGEFEYIPTAAPTEPQATPGETIADNEVA